MILSSDPEIQRPGGRPVNAGRGGRSGNGTIARHERGWGYSLERDDGMGPARARAERLAQIGSVLCFVGMAGLWLWPGSTFSLTVLGIKAGLSVALGVAGLGLGHLAERGLAREVQVDLQRGELRVVWRNRKSEIRLHTVIGFAEVGSVFLRRLPGAGHRTRLNLRYGRTGAVMPLFVGPERLMREVWYDLNGDLHPEEPEQPPRVKAGPRPVAGRRSLPRALR
ncbi:hypothetical protein [Celeribacter sp. SCSIO 80788]|uniref:hypothetical protein n=1 Tax=Celeribacter sp. SCSIO 80788 TaxID=3117013 RepID=UPI003DA40506